MTIMSYVYGFIVFVLVGVTVASTQNVITFDLGEEVPISTEVGNLVTAAELVDKYSLDVLQNFRYRMVDDQSEAAKLLRVDSITSVLKTSSRVDRDTICPAVSTCTLTFDVAISGNADQFQIITIHLNIIDMNDNTPSFDMETFDLHVSESAEIGDFFILPLAHDIDYHPYGVQRYQLTQPAEEFDLNIVTIGGVPTTAQLVLRQKVDREITSSYQLTLYVFDGGEPSRSSSVNINITIGDANDNSPKFDSASYNTTVPEDTDVGVTVLRLHAVDVDAGDNGRVGYYFSSSTDKSYLNIFGIQAGTGAIYLKGNLDYETASDYTLVVEARDKGRNSQPDYASVVIRVSDVNDNAPHIVINTLNGETDAVVSEDDQPGKFVAHVLVRDADGGGFDCTLTPSTLFGLTELESSQFQITVTSELDRETKDVHVVTVTCVDRGSPRLSASQALVIRVTDINDNKPKFTDEVYTIEIDENNYIKKYVAKVNATDADDGVNADITYSIEATARDSFNIDSQTGVIFANAVFDYEKQHDISFNVYARDAGFPSLTSTASVVVLIRDTNDEAPAFSRDVYD